MNYFDFIIIFIIPGTGLLLLNATTASIKTRELVLSYICTLVFANLLTLATLKILFSQQFLGVTSNTNLKFALLSLVFTMLITISIIFFLQNAKLTINATKKTK